MEVLIHIKRNHLLDNIKKNPLQASSDLFIQPSFYEGLGYAVLETMSFGTPALVSYYTAQPEIVKNSDYITNIFFDF